MKKICILIALLFSGFLRAQDVTGKARFLMNASVFQETDFFNSYSPAGGSFLIGTGRIALSGDYRFNRSRFNRYQLLESTSMYSTYITIQRGLIKEEANYDFLGFRFGYSNGDQYKRIMVDDMAPPEDASGQAYNVDFGVIRVRNSVFAAGLNVFRIEHSKSKYMEMMADQYDLEKIGEKKRKMQLNMNLDLLFAPSFDYSRDFFYSPWGYYVPKQVTLKQEIKTRHFGWRIRFEQSGFGGMGYIMEMGMMPGLKASSDLVNDLRFSLKTGLIYSFSYAH